MRLIRLLAATPLVAMVAFWAMQGLQVWAIQAQVARVVDEVRPLLPNGPLAPEKMGPLAVRGKVLFWDMKTNGIRKGAQEKLPANLRGRPGDSPLTVVLVGDVRAERAIPYTDGRWGYRQTATVYLAHWPEVKLLGSATVTAEPLGFVLLQDDQEAYYAPLEEPLVRWIQSIPLETSPVYQQMVAQHRAIQDLLPLLKDATPVRNPMPMKVHGQALVWDLRTNTRSPAHDHLPEELRATKAEGPLTVFAITAVDWEGVPATNWNPAGYQDHVRLSVLTLPDKQRLGTATVQGSLPQTIGSHGPIDKPIADWIVRLPRE